MSLDPAAEAAAPGNAFHPESRQHGVHLPDGAGGVRQPDPQPRRKSAAHAHAFHLLPVQHGLHPHLEVGQNSQRWALATFLRDKTSKDTGIGGDELNIDVVATLTIPK